MTAVEDVIEAEVVVDEPGVYDMPEDLYHADPVPGGSLSASGAKLLLPPSCPALYRHRRDHPKESAAFDYGTAAHKYVLGEGPPVTVVEGDRWDTKAAKAEVAAIREAGGIALKRRDLDQVQAMAAAILEHPLASALFDASCGEAEQSLFWTDGEFGIWRRARLDWLPWTRTGQRLIIGDYKTAAAVDRESIRKAVVNFGYHMQAAQYTDGIRALGLEEDPAFLFVFQMKDAPYLVNVAELEPEAETAGRERMRTACEMFRDCTTSGIWPGYEAQAEDGITHISLPPWATRPAEELL